MPKQIKITDWNSLTKEQKKEAMKLIDSKIPRLGAFTTVFLHKALDRRHNYEERQEDVALVALEADKIIGIVVGRKDLQRKQFWVRFAAGKYAAGIRKYVKEHKTTPVVSMIKRLIRRAEKERLEPQIDPPRTQAGKNTLAKRIQRILPKRKRIFSLLHRR